MPITAPDLANTNKDHPRDGLARAALVEVEFEPPKEGRARPASPPGTPGNSASRLSSLVSRSPLAQMRPHSHRRHLGGSAHLRGIHAAVGGRVADANRTGDFLATGGTVELQRPGVSMISITPFFPLSSSER